MNIFDTRTMLAALEEMKEPKTFLLKTFFSASQEFDTENVDIDVYKGKRRVGVYVNPKGEGNVVDRTGYVTKTYQPPYLKPKMVTTAEDILKRSRGEVMYSGAKSVEQRAGEQLGKDLAELDSIISRTEERQAAQALVEGKISVLDAGGNAIQDEIDFGRESSHTVTLTAGDRWDQTTGDPFADLRTWRNLCLKDSGIASGVVIMDSDSMAAFLANTNVQGLLNRLHIDFGTLQSPVPDVDNAIYYGNIAGFDIYEYNEWYIDPVTGVETSMIPAKHVIVGSKNAYCQRLYGAIRVVDAMAAVPRFPKSWITEDPSNRWVQLHSAPLVAPHQVDAFLCAKVLS